MHRYTSLLLIAIALANVICMAGKEDEKDAADPVKDEKKDDKKKCDGLGHYDGKKDNKKEDDTKEKDGEETEDKKKDNKVKGEDHQRTGS